MTAYDVTYTYCSRGSSSEFETRVVVVSDNGAVGVERACKVHADNLGRRFVNIVNMAKRDLDIVLDPGGR